MSTTHKPLISLIIILDDNLDNLETYLQKVTPYSEELEIIALGTNKLSGNSFIASMKEKFPNVYFDFRSSTSKSAIKNLGLERATGRWIMFTTPAETISSVYELCQYSEYAQKNNLNLAIWPDFELKSTEKNDEELEKYTQKAISRLEHRTCNFCLISNNFLKINNFQFDETAHFTEDQEFINSIAQRINKFAISLQPLSRYISLTKHSPSHDNTNINQDEWFAEQYKFILNLKSIFELYKNKHPAYLYLEKEFLYEISILRYIIVTKNKLFSRTTVKQIAQYLKIIHESILLIHPQLNLTLKLQNFKKKVHNLFVYQANDITLRESIENILISYDDEYVYIADSNFLKDILYFHAYPYTVKYLVSSENSLNLSKEICNVLSENPDFIDKKNGIAYFVNADNDELFIAYRKTHPNKKIILRYVDKFPLSKRSRKSYESIKAWLNYIRENKLVDGIETYDSEDALTYHIDYQPNVVNPISLRNIQSNRETSTKYSYFYMGTMENNRLLSLKSFFQKSKTLFPSLDSFSMIRGAKPDVYIPYSKYIEFLVHGEFIIDMWRRSQDEGYSYRIAEALFLKKKVITNRLRVLHEPFYHPSRFFVIGHDSLGRIKSFIETEFLPICDSELSLFDIRGDWQSDYLNNLEQIDFGDKPKKRRPNEIKLSIIIPFYNQEQFLMECLDSIDTRYDSIEILLVDDGSDDQSPNIARQFVSQHQNAKLLKLAHKGVSAARNFGLENAKGEWVTFIDSDDALIDTGCLFNMIDFSLLNHLSFVVAPHAKTHLLPKHQQVKTNIKILKISDLTIGTSTSSIILRELLDKHNIRFIDNLSYSEDRIFVATISQHITKFGFMQNPFYWYRKNINSLCHSNAISYAMRFWHHLNALFYYRKYISNVPKNSVCAHYLNRELHNELKNLRRDLKKQSCMTLTYWKQLLIYWKICIQNSSR